MTTTFNRAALYEAVWTTPITRLAPTYGLSDNGLRKVCKALNVPMPPRGYWARIEAGQVIERPPLAPEAERTNFVSAPGPRDNPHRSPADVDWLTARAAFEAAPDRAITVAMPPRRWHLAVIPLRDGQRKVWRDLQKARANNETHQHRAAAGRSVGMNEGYQWLQFERRGQILADTHRGAVLRVSPQTLERSLAILDALCWAAKAREFQVSMSDSGHRLVLTGHGGTVEVRVSEGHVVDWRPSRSTWRDAPTQDKVRVPNGELRLYVGHGWGTGKEFRDRPEKPLEQRLNDVFMAGYRQIVRDQVADRKHKAWNDEYEAKLKQQRLAKQLIELSRRLGAYNAKQKADAVAEAERWRQSQLLRDYVATVRCQASQPGHAVSPSVASWITWATEVADEIDPLPIRLESPADQQPNDDL